METTGLPNTQIEQEILQLAIVDENGQTLFFESFKPTFRKRWQNAYKRNDLLYSNLKYEKELNTYKSKIIDILNQADQIIGYNLFQFDFQMLLEAQIFTSKEHFACDLMPIFTDIFKEKSRFHNLKYKKQSRLTFVQYYGFLTTGFENCLGKAQGQLHAYKEMIIEEGENFDLGWKSFKLNYSKPLENSQETTIQTDLKDTKKSDDYSNFTLLLIVVVSIIFLILLFQLLT